jgi:hypothetical protein
MISRHLHRKKLYAYLEDEVDSAARRSIEGHLERCASCRGRLAEAQALLSRLQDLTGPATPSRDLWPEIEDQVGGAEPSVRSLEASHTHVKRHAPTGQRQIRDRVRGRWSIAAAATLLIIAGGILATVRSGSNPEEQRSAPLVGRTVPGEPGGTGTVTAADVDGVYQPIIARLRHLVDERSEQLGWDLAASAQDDLASIGAALADIREALRLDPDSRELLEKLDEGYQQHIWLLERLASVARL